MGYGNMTIRELLMEQTGRVQRAACFSQPQHLLKQMDPAQRARRDGTEPRLKYLVNNQVCVVTIQRKRHE